MRKKLVELSGLGTVIVGRGKNRVRVEREYFGSIRAPNPPRKLAGPVRKKEGEILIHGRTVIPYGGIDIIRKPPWSVYRIGSFAKLVDAKIPSWRFVKHREETDKRFTNSTEEATFHVHQIEGAIYDIPEVSLPGISTQQKAALDARSGSVPFGLSGHPDYDPKGARERTGDYFAFPDNPSFGEIHFVVQRKRGDDEPTIWGLYRTNLSKKGFHLFKFAPGDY